MDENLSPAYDWKKSVFLSSMWIQRTPQEIAEWQKNAEKHARGVGLMIGALSWALAAVVYLFFQSATPQETSFGGSPWIRVLILAVIGSPFILIVRRIVGRQELRKVARRTVCPQCETLGEGNADSACNCGGTFVLFSNVKWMEK